MLRAQARELTALAGPPEGLNLYAWADRLGAAVRRAYPKTKCQAGCDGCCASDTALFLVSAAEWALIQEEVEQRWSPEQRARLQARLQAEHAPHRGAYRWAWLWARIEPLGAWVWGARPYRCPFLEGGRCSVYAARPLACRMYGHFAMPRGLRRPPGIYACRMQTEVYEGVPDLALPSVNMVWAASRPFLGPGLRLLPAWAAKAWPTARPLEGRPGGA